MNQSFGSLLQIWKRHKRASNNFMAILRIAIQNYMAVTAAVKAMNTLRKEPISGGKVHQKPHFKRRMSTWLLNSLIRERAYQERLFRGLFAVCMTAFWKIRDVLVDYKPWYWGDGKTSVTGLGSNRELRSWRVFVSCDLTGFQDSVDDLAEMERRQYGGNFKVFVGTWKCLWEQVYKSSNYR